jgi:hypothetical protein
MSARVSLVFTTIRRQQCARRLIESARAAFPAMPIHVADQDEACEALRDLCRATDVRHHRIGPDAGAAHARNVLLQQVDTDYFLLADDDFVLSAGARLGPAVAFLDAHPEFSFLGGDLDEYPPEAADGTALPRTLARSYPKARNLVREPTGKGLIMVPAVAVKTPVVEHAGETFQVCDLVSHWGMGRTGRFGRGGLAWDPQFKIGPEHYDLFLEAQRAGAHRVAFWPGLRAEHRPWVDAQYMELRRRDYWPAFAAKWDLEYMYQMGGQVRWFASFARGSPVSIPSCADSPAVVGDDGELERLRRALQAAREANATLRRHVDRLRGGR